jgi:hypothetical protein
MVLTTSPFYSGTLTTQTTVTATSPYVAETNVGNNQSIGQVQVRQRFWVYLPLIIKEE